MKKISLVVGIFMALFIVSCEGPQGPPGYDGIQGPPGADGSEFEAIVFEVEANMALNPDANRYEFGELFSVHGITLFPDDAILVYRLEEVDNGIDVWRQLPQPFLTDLGTMYYNFDFTKNDYKVYLEPDFDAAAIATSLVTNQVFRVFIVPANLGLSSKMDKSNMGAVMQALGVSEKEVVKIKAN